LQTIFPFGQSSGKNAPPLQGCISTNYGGDSLSGQAEWPASQYSQHVYTILWPSMFDPLEMFSHVYFTQDITSFCRYFHYSGSINEYYHYNLTFVNNDMVVV
ncbi:MAG: hypothetical protein ACJ788_19010, partial [Ktedonobacteraceae bacterium]